MIRIFFSIPETEVFPDSRTGFVSLQTAVNNFIEGRQCGAAYRTDFNSRNKGILLRGV